MTDQSVWTITIWGVVGAIQAVIAADFFVDKRKTTEAQDGVLFLGLWLITPLVTIILLILGAKKGFQGTYKGLAEWKQELFHKKKQEVLSSPHDSFLEAAKREVNQIAPN